MADYIVVAQHEWDRAHGPSESTNGLYIKQLKSQEEAGDIARQSARSTHLEYMVVKLVPVSLHTANVSTTDKAL